jgi:hypothetical protein
MTFALPSIPRISGGVATVLDMAADVGASPRTRPPGPLPLRGIAVVNRYGRDWPVCVWTVGYAGPRDDSSPSNPKPSTL